MAPLQTYGCPMVVDRDDILYLAKDNVEIARRSPDAQTVKEYDVPTPDAVEAACGRRPRTRVRGLHLSLFYEIHASSAAVHSSCFPHHETGKRGARHHRLVAGLRSLQTRVPYIVGMGRCRQSALFRPRRKPPSSARGVRARHTA